jgi:hypothetical protein
MRRRVSWVLIADTHAAHPGVDGVCEFGTVYGSSAGLWGLDLVDVEGPRPGEAIGVG